MIKLIQPGKSDNASDGVFSDSEAWKAFLDGDCEAFQYLFQTYYDDLYHYAVKFSGDPAAAEDHIQKLFLKLWRKRERLEKVKGVKTYLWSALRRSMIDTHRKRKTERKYRDEYQKNHGRMHYSAEELLIRDEINAIRSSELQAAIHQLSPKEREVLYLKFYEGMSYKEIEQIMSVNYQTTRNYVYRALQSLKELLSPEAVLGLLLVGLLSIPTSPWL